MSAPINHPRLEQERLDALATDDLYGVCGHCDREVRNSDSRDRENHRITPILGGGRGVECRLRGDY